MTHKPKKRGGGDTGLSVYNNSKKKKKERKETVTCDSKTGRSIQYNLILNNDFSALAAPGICGLHYSHYINVY